MDGIELPENLEWIIEKMGIQWPDAKEIAMMQRGVSWGLFASKGLVCDQQVCVAVDGMLVGNHSEGLTAFKEYFETVAGVKGCMAQAVLVNGVTGVLLVQAGILIMEFKVLILRCLAELAELAIEAAAAAAETGGASVAAWYGALAETDAGLEKAKDALIAALGVLGAPLSEIAGRLLDAGITHLRDRRVHQGPDAVTSFTSHQEREEAARRDAERRAELAKDPDHNGKVGEGSEREADIILNLEKMRVFPTDSLARPDGPAQGDFVETKPDGTTQLWDIKGIPSYDPTDITYRRKHCYTDEKAEAAIEEMLHKDPPRHVIMDMAKMNTEDRASLEALIRRHPEWLGKVKVY